MAKFNPDVEFQLGPKYGGDSRPISDIKYQSVTDETLERTLTGAGKMIASVATAGKTLAEDYLGKKVREDVEQRRDKFTVDLSVADVMARNLPGANRGVDNVSGTATTDDLEGGPNLGKPNEGSGGDLTDFGGVSRFTPAGSAGQSILEPEAKPLPPALDILPGELDTKLSARAGGKLSMTQYYADAAARAKQLRNQFPGWEDYIDAQFSARLGVDPANATIKGLLGDINSFITSANSQQNKIIAFGRQNLGIAGVEELLGRYIQNPSQQTELQLYSTVAARKRIDDAYDIEHKALSLGIQRDQYQQVALGRTASAVAGADVTGMLNKVALANGLSPAGLADLVTRQQLGQAKEMTATEATQYAFQLQALESSGYQNWVAKMKTPNANGISAYDVLGKEKIDQTWEKNIAPLRAIRTSLVKGDITLAGSMSAMVEAKKADYYRLLPEDLKKAMAISTLMKDSGTDQASKAFFQNFTNKFTDKAINEWVKLFSMETTVQPDQNQGFIHTYSEKVSDVQRKLGPNGAKMPKEALSPVYGEIVNQIQSIADPNTPEKWAVGRAVALVTSSDDMILKFDRSQQMGIFRSITTEGMAAKFKELDKQQPGLWAGYQQFVRSNYSHMFKQDVLQLGQLEGRGNTVAWDTEKKQFTITPPDPMEAAKKGYIVTEPPEQIKALEKRINTGLASVKEMAKHSGEDVEVYVGRLLGDLGYAPFSRGGSAKIPEGVPTQMLRSILMSRGKAAQLGAEAGLAKKQAEELKNY